MVAILGTLTGLLYLAFFAGLAAYLAWLIGLPVGPMVFLAFLSLCTPFLTITVLAAVAAVKWETGTLGKPRGAS